MDIISLGAYSSDTDCFNEWRCFRSILQDQSDCNGGNRVNTVLKIKIDNEITLLFVCEACSPLTTSELSSYIDDEVKDQIPTFRRGEYAEDPHCCSSKCNVLLGGNQNAEESGSTWVMNGCHKLMCYRCTKQSREISLDFKEQAGDTGMDSVLDETAVASLKSEVFFGNTATAIKEAADKKCCKVFTVQPPVHSSVPETNICGILGINENFDYEELGNFMATYPLSPGGSSSPAVKKRRVNIDVMGDAELNVDGTVASAIPSQDDGPGCNGNNTNAVAGTLRIDGGLYVGEVLDGQPHGHGKVFSTKEQMIYTGQWIAGKRTGQGKWVSFLDDHFEKEKTIAKHVSTINKLRLQNTQLTLQNTTPTAEAAPITTNDSQVANPQSLTGPQIAPSDLTLQLTAGSLVQCSYKDRGGEIKGFSIVNRDAHGKIVFCVVFNGYVVLEPTDVVALRPVAICVMDNEGKGVGYRSSLELGNTWYQPKKVVVNGSLTDDDLQRMYRICIDWNNRRNNDDTIHFINGVYPKRWKEPEDAFYLSDSYGDNSQIPAQQLPCFIFNFQRILQTSDEGIFWLRHLIPDATFFRPITVAETNVFVIVVAYDLRDWFNRNHQHFDSKDVAYIKQCIDCATDPLDLQRTQSIQVASVVAYSFALIRLFASVSVTHQQPIMKPMKCICCSGERSNMLQPVGLQTFVLPGMKEGFKNSELHPFLLPGQSGGDRYKHHNIPILEAAFEGVTVDSFLEGRRKLHIKDIPGSAKAMLGLSVAMYIYLGDRARSFRSVVSHLAMMSLNQPPEQDLKIACENCLKKGCKLQQIFGGSEKMQNQVNIVITVAKVLDSLDLLQPPDLFEKVFKLAISIPNFDNGTLVDNGSTRLARGNVVLEPELANDERVIAILTRVRTWGETVVKVDFARQRVNDPSVLLYAAIKQLGPLEHFFYGPLAQIGQFEEPSNGYNVGSMLERLNLRSCVAVNPVIGEELLQMVKTALIKQGITTSEFDPFVCINESQMADLSADRATAFSNFSASYGLLIPSFQYTAARTLFTLTDETG